VSSLKIDIRQTRAIGLTHENQNRAASDRREFLVQSLEFVRGILKAIKSGGLASKAIPNNRNDANSKFRLPKTKAKARVAGREVTNFVLIDLAGFDAWFEASKVGIRTMIALNRTQVVMPRLEEIVAGKCKYTSE
jgi:hypothetical protein